MSFIWCVGLVVLLLMFVDSWLFGVKCSGCILLVVSVLFVC